MSGRAWLLFVASSVMGGATYLFIRVAVEGIPPTLLVFLRGAIGFVILLPLALSRNRTPLVGLRHRLRWLIALAALQVTVPYLLLSIAEQHISSSLASLLVSSQPLIVAILAHWFDPREQTDVIMMAALIVDLAGVGLLLGAYTGGDRLVLLGCVLALAAAACYAASALLLARSPQGASQLELATATLAINSVLLAAPAASQLPAITPTVSAAIAVIALGTINTGVGFVVYFSLIQEAGATKASVVTYVSPAVSIVLGSLLLHERVGWSTLVGFLLIATSSGVATVRGRRLNVAQARKTS